jgi:hypothetical protein
MARSGTSAGGEFLAGCRDEAPLLLGVALVGMIYGIAALAADVPAWLAQLASAIVFAGAAQLVIAHMLTAGAGFIPIALTSGLLNLRHVLYSASMAAYARLLPRRWRLLLAYVLTDEAYAVAVLHSQRRATEASTDGSTPAVGGNGAEAPPDCPRDLPSCRHIAPASFAALTASALFVAGGEVVFAFDAPRPWAALVAVLVAWRTRNVLATIGAGMAALYLLKLLFPT